MFKATYIEETDSKLKIYKDQFETEKADVYSKPPKLSFSQYKEVTGFGIGFAAIVGEILISHPFVVFRRQCQVNSFGKCLHLLPFTTIPVFNRIITNQGFASFWKGLTSSLIINGMVLGIESLISELYRLPKEISAHSSLKRIAQHVILKSIAWAFITPVYAGHIIECVQSDIASEAPSLFSCFREASRRFWIPKNFFRSTQKWSSTLKGDFSKLKPNQEKNSKLSEVKKAISTRLPITTSRLLPYWTIVGPVVLFNVGHYTIRSIAYYLIRNYYKKYNYFIDREDVYVASSSKGTTFNEVNLSVKGEEWNEVIQEREEAALQATYVGYYTELTVMLWASFTADVILYPLETIVVRLCVQGTRTLVDNLDSGDSIIPVVTAYDGMRDVWQESLRSATGLLGLYKGFGAIILQYSFQAGFLIGIKYLYERLLYSQSFLSSTNTSNAHLSFGDGSIVKKDEDF